jgi:hypothetical protein
MDNKKTVDKVPSSILNELVKIMEPRSSVGQPRPGASVLDGLVFQFSPSIISRIVKEADQPSLATSTEVKPEEHSVVKIFANILYKKNELENELADLKHAENELQDHKDQEERNKFRLQEELKCLEDEASQNITREPDKNIFFINENSDLVVVTENDNIADSDLTNYLTDLNLSEKEKFKEKCKNLLLEWRSRSRLDLENSNKEQERALDKEKELEKEAELKKEKEIEEKQNKILEQLKNKREQELEHQLQEAESNMQKIQQDLDHLNWLKQQKIAAIKDEENEQKILAKKKEELEDILKIFKLSIDKIMVKNLPKLVDNEIIKNNYVYGLEPSNVSTEVADITRGLIKEVAGERVPKLLNQKKEERKYV